MVRIYWYLFIVVSNSFIIFWYENSNIERRIIKNDHNVIIDSDITLVNTFAWNFIYNHLNKKDDFTYLFHYTFYVMNRKYFLYREEFLKELWNLTVLFCSWYWHYFGSMIYIYENKFWIVKKSIFFRNFKNIIVLYDENVIRDTLYLSFFIGWRNKFCHVFTMWN